MSFRRRPRLIIVLLALISLLSMQTALASYACPGTMEKVNEIAAMAEAGMPCAESMSLNMDDDQPSLCHAHCQASQQSADTYELPPLVALSALPALFTVPITAPVYAGLQLQAPQLERMTDPPIAIRNCCFRI